MGLEQVRKLVLGVVAKRARSNLLQKWQNVQLFLPIKCSTWQLLVNHRPSNYTRKAGSVHTLSPRCRKRAAFYLNTLALRGTWPPSCRGRWNTRTGRTKPGLRLRLCSSLFRRIFGQRRAV